jgi:site-specific DNA-methyltransferase (adenine-specific)
VVTDPPYDLLTTSRNGSRRLNNPDTPAGRSARGFMGKTWDGTGVGFRVETWAEAFRLLKPGGHLLSFGGTRTYHRLACAIEDAGFEIRDCLVWGYASGFAKSRAFWRLEILPEIERQLREQGVEGEIAWR